MIGLSILISFISIIVLVGMAIWIYSIVDDFICGYSDDALMSLGILIFILVFATSFVLIGLGI